MPDSAFLRTFRRQHISHTVPSGSDPCWDECGDSYSLDYRAACLRRRLATLTFRSSAPSESVTPL